MWQSQRIQTTIHLRVHMDRLHWARDVRVFHAMLIFWNAEPKPMFSRFHYHAQQQLYSVHFPCETNGNFSSITLLTVFFLVSYDYWTWSITNKAFDEMHVRSIDRQQKMQLQFVDNHIHQFMVGWYSSISLS